MSTFKHNKGKLVEQPTMEKPKCFTGNSSDRDCPDCKAYHDHIASLRTYIAEGNFLEDELVEEKDLEIIYQIGSKCGWYSIPYEIFKPYPNELRKRIIARKVTKEEGEKPEQIGKESDRVTIERMGEINLKLNQEIERLKRLLEKEVKQNEWSYWVDAGYPDAELKADEHWNKFKIENNLT